MDMTVVIPTYNGASRLPAVLDRLLTQVVADGIQWEVLVVDNNSQDDTAEVVKQYQQTWSQTASLKYVFEPQQGLAFARQCGVDNADGALVGFLDDDNWPDPNWVMAAIEFGQEYPQVGVYGSKTEAAFERPPDMSIKAIAKLLALQNYGDNPYQFQPQRQILPAGAGLVVRRQAWLACMPTTLVRVSQGGDDYEISLRLAHQGWEIYYNPAMVIQHYIPAARLEPGYLLQLAHRYGLCTCELMMINVPGWKQPLLLTKFFLGTVKRVGQHTLKHGWRDADISLQCQLNFHLGNLKSPFAYVLKSLRS